MAKELKITLNTTHEFPINSYTRNTNIHGDEITSNAYVGLKNPTFAQLDELRTLAANTVTDLLITSDGDEVYRLNNQTAKIISIEETITEEGMVRTFFNLAL